MDAIKQALARAKSDKGPTDSTKRPRGGSGPPTGSGTVVPPEVFPNPRHLEDERVVAHAMSDPAHIAFNQLRTRVYKSLSEKAWNSVAITSPTLGCGKTVVAANLAFSLARQASFKTVLVDLDLKKPSVARMLGVSAKASVGSHLQGEAAFEDCFVRIGDYLILGLNDRIVRHSAELVHDHRMAEFIDRIGHAFGDCIVLYDLPPMLASDDAIAFLPHADTSLLVIASGQTTISEVDECEKDCSEATHFLGVVLNKSTERPTQYVGYEGID